MATGTTDGAPRPESRGLPWDVEFSWAPDGQRLATYSSDDPERLTIVSVDGERVGTVALPS